MSLHTLSTLHSPPSSPLQHPTPQPPPTFQRSNVQTLPHSFLFVFPNLLLKNPTPILTDLQWQTIQHLFPDLPPSRGRPRLSNRRILDAIFWKLISQSPWYALPPDAPPHQTVYRRYIEWLHSGLIRKIIAALADDLDQRGGIDLPGAFHNGQVKLSFVNGVWHCDVPGELHGTWQHTTTLAIFFATLDLQRHHQRRSKFSFGL